MTSDRSQRNEENQNQDQACTEGATANTTVTVAANRNKQTIPATLPIRTKQEHQLAPQYNKKTSKTTHQRVTQDLDVSHFVCTASSIGLEIFISQNKRVAS